MGGEGGIGPENEGPLGGRAGRPGLHLIPQPPRQTRAHPGRAQQTPDCGLTAPSQLLRPRLWVGVARTPSCVQQRALCRPGERIRKAPGLGGPRWGGPPTPSPGPGALVGPPQKHIIPPLPPRPPPPPAAVPPARPGPTEAGSGQKVGLGPGAQFQDGWTTQRAVATSPRARVASLSSGTIPSLPRPTEAGTLAGWLGSARGEVSGPRGAWGTSVKPGSCGDNPHMQLPGLAFSTSKGPCARKVWSGPERWQGAVTAQGTKAQSHELPPDQALVSAHVPGVGGAGLPELPRVAGSLEMSGFLPR